MKKLISMILLLTMLVGTANAGITDELYEEVKDFKEFNEFKRMEENGDCAMLMGSWLYILGNDCYLNEKYWDHDTTKIAKKIMEDLKIKGYKDEEVVITVFRVGNGILWITFNASIDLRAEKSGLEGYEEPIYVLNILVYEGYADLMLALNK